MIEAEHGRVALDAALGAADGPPRPAMPNLRATLRPPATGARAVFDSESLAFAHPVDARRLAAALAEPALGLVRAKALVRDLDGTPTEVQVVGAHSRARAGAHRDAARGRLVCICRADASTARRSRPWCEAARPPRASPGSDFPRALAPRVLPCADGTGYAVVGARRRRCDELEKGANMNHWTRRDVLHAAALGGASSIFGLPLDAAAQAARGGTLVIGYPQTPRSLNPAIQSGAAAMMPGAQLFATPLRFDAKWQPHPYLAERWILSDDGRSVTLFLRKDAKFHDGRPVTSADVQFSVETVRDHHPFKTMFAPVNGVTLPDAHTAVIRLAEPHPALLLAMSSALLPILPKHVFGDGQPILTHPRNANPVRSGPFKLVEFKPGEHLIMERFDRLLPERARLLDRIVLRYFRDPASMLLALERGEIDAHTGMVDAREIERARKIPASR